MQRQASYEDQKPDTGRRRLSVQTWRIVRTALLVVVMTASAFSQGVHVQARPKIGLALSGGGARGFAHIGLLEWLEEHRIPVDYIAGTSMGGLVGAMYATGMTPAEMRRLVNGIDWDDALRGAPAYDQLTFRRKEDRRSYPNPIELGLRGGLRAPSGLDAASNIGLIINRLCLPYSTIASFDDLPTPFRCVATDMVAAEPVVLKSGSLSQALRATMAVPGVFTPVEIDGKVLADGGLLNNVPTDVVKQMGADVVIAVDIGTPLGDRKSLDSFLGMLNQSVNVLTIESVRRNLRLADIILSPNLENYTFADYQDSNAIANLGYKGAAQKALVLQNLALDETAWQQHLGQRRARQRGGATTPAFLKIVGAGDGSVPAIRKKLGKYVGHPLTPPRLETDLTYITGWGRYSGLGYEITRGNPGDGLLIRVAEKSHGPPFLNVGLEINGANTSDLLFNVRSRLTALDIGGYGSEWRTDLSLGSRTLVATEYYRPFGDHGWFVAPRTFFDLNTKSLFQNGFRVADYQTKKTGLGLDLGYNFGRFSELRFGYEVARLAALVRIGDPRLPNLTGTVSSASLRWTFDGLDSAVVPTRGVRAQTETRWFFGSPGATSGFPLAEANLSAFKPFGELNVLFVRAAGGTTFSKDAPPVQQFTLGGPLRLGAYGQDEFRGSRYLFSSLGYLRQVSQLPLLLGGKVYAGGWYEYGGTFNRIDPAKYFHSLSLGLVMETKLGPLFIGGSLGEGGRQKVYFLLGRLF